MKIRLGFISNSSSSSTIVSLQAYDYVVDLMIHVMEMIIEEEEGGNSGADLEMFSKVLYNLKGAKEAGLDPNFPTRFGGGYDTTRVVRTEAGYHLTCHIDHDLLDLKGPMDEWVEGGYGDPDVEDYYLPQYDLIGKELRYKGEGKKCNKHYVNLKTREGVVFCPFCNPGKLDSLQISSKRDAEKP